MNFTLLILLLLCKSIGEVIVVSDDYGASDEMIRRCADMYREELLVLYINISALSARQG